MPSRVELQTILENLLGSSYVYFQPPESIKMQYPCIVYSRNTARTSFADNRPYAHHTGYQLTVIDKNPDSEIPGRIAALPLCSFSNHYTKDNLNHDIFTIYY
jgi:hypothetical protein